MGSFASAAASIHVQSKPSRAQAQQGELDGSSRAVVAATSQSNVIGDAQQPSELKQTGTKESHAVSKDPNVVGFVPAFILGDIHVCKLPERQVPLHAIRACALRAPSQEPHMQQRFGCSCFLPSFHATQHLPTCASTITLGFHPHNANAPLQSQMHAETARPSQHMWTLLMQKSLLLEWLDLNVLLLREWHL